MGGGSRHQRRRDHQHPGQRRRTVLPRYQEGHAPDVQHQLHDAEARWLLRQSGALERVEALQLRPHGRAGGQRRVDLQPPRTPQGSREEQLLLLPDDGGAAESRCGRGGAHGLQDLHHPRHRAVQGSAAEGFQSATERQNARR